MAAVNDPPEIDAPSFIQAVEDVPYLFEPSKKPEELGGTCSVPLLEGGCPQIECPEANERFAVYGRLIYGCLPVQILDPDMEDFGFADKPFMLVISALHGAIFLDEEFLQKAEERKQNQPGNPAMCTNCLTNLQAQEECCRCNTALPGCSIQYDESGAQWMIDRGMRPRGLHRSGSPEFGVGNQHLAIRGESRTANAESLFFPMHPCCLGPRFSREGNLQIRSAKKRVELSQSLL